jgi:hypothetical protein
MKISPLRHSLSLQPNLNPKEARIKMKLYPSLGEVKPTMKIRPKLVIIRHSQSKNVANLLLLILVPMQDSKTVMLSAIQMPSFSALQVVFIYLIFHQMRIIQSLH